VFKIIYNLFRANIFRFIKYGFFQISVNTLSYILLQQGVETDSIFTIEATAKKYLFMIGIVTTNKQIISYQEQRGKYLEIGKENL